MDHHRALVIFTFKSTLPSSHLHLQVIFIWIWIITWSRSSSLDLDHHSIWIIITESRSSLDLAHHHWIWIITRSGSPSLDLDHHLIWIITTGSGSSLDLDHLWSGTSLLDHHHRCYLIILLVTGSSTKPAVFHASCSPSLHVGLLHHLYLTLSQNGPPSSYIWPHLVRKAFPALTSDLILSERPSTHIWPCVNTSRQNGSALISNHVRTHYIGRALHLHPTMCKHTA